LDKFPPIWRKEITRPGLRVKSGLVIRQTPVMLKRLVAGTATFIRTVS